MKVEKGRKRVKIIVKDGKVFGISLPEVIINKRNVRIVTTRIL